MWRGARGGLPTPSALRRNARGGGHFSAAKGGGGVMCKAGWLVPAPDILGKRGRARGGVRCAAAQQRDVRNRRRQQNCVESYSSLCAHSSQKTRRRVGRCGGGIMGACKPVRTRAKVRNAWVSSHANPSAPCPHVPCAPPTAPPAPPHSRRLCAADHSCSPSLSVPPEGGWRRIGDPSRACTTAGSPRCRRATLRIRGRATPQACAPRPCISTCTSLCWEGTPRGAQPGLALHAGVQRTTVH